MPRDPVREGIDPAGQIVPPHRIPVASYRLAASVAQFAEMLRESPDAARVGYAQILEQAGAATNDLDRPADAVEFIDLVRKAAALPK